MTIGAAQQFFLGASKATGGGAAGYQIERSLRFSSNDSGYLSRTPAVAGNRRTWTWAGWVKRSALGTNQLIFGSSTIWFELTFNTSNQLQIYWESGGTGSNFLYSNPVYRDVSAWMHIVFAVDTTQATASNRIRVYVNGSEITWSSASYPSQNYDTGVNSTNVHGIGSRVAESNLYFSGYFAECYLSDGQQLTPSSFTEVSATTGQLIPKAYTGSFGTNGFWLKFSDNSAATATTLGKDYSGNSNNWTPNNLSVTAGAGNDSLVDTPTSYGTDTGAGGEVRGNYCTLNPLSTTAGTYTQGNLRYEGANADRRSNGTIAVSTGKWYWEVTLGNAPFSPRSSGSQHNAFGFGLSTAFNSTTGPRTLTDAVVLMDNGYYKNFSGADTDGGTAFASGDVLSCAVDLDANTFTFRRNNTQIVTGTIGGTVGRELVPIVISYGGAYGVMDCNFGQRAFAYTAPSGFKALVDTNLTAPVIAKPNTVMDAILYSGNSSTQSITSLAFSPDLVWSKCRNVVRSHRLSDAVRGSNRDLYSDVTYSEVADGSITAFTANGFNLDNSTGSQYNTSGETYVSWCWDAGASTVTNTQGSITSQVRANASAGFSVVSWSANNTANQSIGHGLGVTPAFIIHKNRTTAGNWNCWFTGFSNDEYINLNGTGAKANTGGGLWYQTPTSSLFYIGFTGSAINNSTDAIISYCFAPVAGYSSFGSYTGNGSTDGPFVYTGFRPRWVMIKYTSGPISDISNARWLIVDSARNTYNVVTQRLEANSSGSEITDTSILDFTSNGFKIRWHPSDVANSSGATYIYAAFAENPLQYARAR